MTQVELIAEEVTVETTESEAPTLTLSELDLVGGGNASVNFL